MRRVDKTYSDDEAINYIIALENPHKVGWDKSKKIWRTPKGKGFDNNQIAYGLDTRLEHNPLVYNYLKDNGRLNNPWLTDQEARSLAMQTYRQKKDSVIKAIEIAGGNVSQRGYNILSGMAWHGHPMKSVLSPDSITGKAFRNAIKQGDQDFDSVFDTYYQYGSNAKQFAERIKADKAFRPEADVETYVMKDGTKKMVFSKPDWSKSKVEIPNPWIPKTIDTQYPIGSDVPQSINSWNGAGSPAYGGSNVFIPDTQTTTDKYRKKIEDAFDKSLLNIDYSPTYNKFEIPKANCGKDKLPRFDEGTPYTVGPYTIYPSAVAEAQKGDKALLNATWNGPDIPIVGTDRRPLYQRYDAENSVYDGNTIRNITDWAPGIGDVSQGFDAVNAFKNNKYEEAALLGGLLLLPNALEPIAKPLFKAVARKAEPIKSAITNAVSNIPGYNDAVRALRQRWSPELFDLFDNDVPKYYGQNMDSYPTAIKESLENSVYPRMRKMRPWMTDDQFRGAFDYAADGKYTVYPKRTFQDAGENAEGLYYPSTDHIAIEEGKTFDALGHEVEHKIDEAIPLTEKEETYLTDAYDDDFLSLGGARDGYNMAPERKTLNYDSRRELLGWDVDEKVPVEQQNKMIDAASDAEIFAAVENSNGYGRDYIELKRKTKGLTKDLANKIRKSMKYVGAAQAPIAAGTALGWQASKLDEEDYDNAMSRLKTLVDGLGMYANGKDIYIKPSKRGTFTAAAKKRGKSVQAFASQVLNNPNKYSKAMRKKAQFARNASKWKH